MFELNCLSSPQYQKEVEFEMNFKFRIKVGGINNEDIIDSVNMLNEDHNIKELGNLLVSSCIDQKIKNIKVFN